MKTILFIITQSEFGGAQTYIFDLARKLNKDYRIGVIAGCQNMDNIFKQKLIDQKISYYCVPSLKRSISPINDIKAIYKLINIINLIKPSVLHLNSSKVSIIGSIVGAIIKSKYYGLNPKIIYTVHGWVFLEPQNKLTNKIYKFAEKFTSKYKNTIICINNNDATVAKNTLNIPANKIKIISNGIEISSEFKEKQNALNSLLSKPNLTKLKINKNTTLIGSIGNLYPTKDFITFIKAFKLTKTALQIQINNDINIKAIIIGEGAERNKLEKLIREENLTDDIFLAGSINNARSFLKAFDIYICSSIKEGLPYTLLEAGLANLPVIATDVGGIKDIIINNENGALVNPKDSQALAQATKKLIDNADIRALYATNLNKTISKNFTLNSMITKTKKLYDN